MNERPEDIPVAVPPGLRPRTEVSPPRTPRLPYLDDLKVVLVAAVIAGHAAMTYGASGTWILEVGQFGQRRLTGLPEALLSFAIGLGALFAIGLFMLIAGMLTPASVRRKGAGTFARDRILRLGLPLAAYVLVVWPLLGLLIDSTIGDAHGAVWPRYTERLGGFDSGPMWFVAILLAYSLVYAAWARLAATRRRRRHGPLRSRALVLTAVAIAACSFVARLAWPIDTHQILDLHLWLWPQCAVLFTFGIVSAERGWLAPVPDESRRRCRIAAVAAVGIVLTVLVTVGGDDASFKGGLHPQAFLIDGFEGVFAVAMSVSCLAVFQHRRRHRTTLGQWCSDSAYGAFFAQGPVLVALALVLSPLAAPAGLKFIGLAMGGVSGSFALGGAGRKAMHHARAALERNGRETEEAGGSTIDREHRRGVDTRPERQ